MRRAHQIRSTFLYDKALYKIKMKTGS